MTSQQDIQSLIADIDSILHKPDTRLPWSKLGDMAQERRVLERVRSYLVSQQHVAKPDRSPAANSASPEVVQQLAQAVRQEMHGLRTDLFDHLRTDIDALRHERENLIGEIRQLERHKQQMHALAQNQTVPEQTIAEVSQALINHCTESLTQQITQVLASWELHLTGADVKPSIASSTQPKLLAPTATHQSQLGSVLHPQERIEHLRQLQAQFDQMLLTLDANQRAIFDALQRNLQSYQQSLGQGLEKMHSLGVQGEMLFAALVHRLAQPLEQDSSTPVPTSQQQPELASSTEQDLTLDLPTQTQTPRQPLQPTKSPLTPSEKGERNQTEAIAQGNSLENLHTGDWEAIEGLDLDDVEVEPEDDGLDTFIQLDMNAQLARPAIIGQTEAPHQDPQAPDSGELDTDNHHQEIEELYQSLFGTEALPGTAKLETVDLPVDPALQLPKDDQLLLGDTVNSSSAQIEDVLFAGLADPATPATEHAHSQEQPLEPPVSPSHGSWEELFFEDPVTQSGHEVHLPTTSTSHQDGTGKQETIEIITALTDLIEDMGTSQSSSIGESMPMTTTQELVNPSSKTDAQATSSEDNYIPASPDEDLLATDELESEQNLDIHPDPNTLQQLQQDLYSYGQSESQNTPRQEQHNSPNSAFDPLLLIPDATPNNPPHGLPLVEELLAEDYEELAPPATSTDSGTIDLSIHELEQFDPNQDSPKSVIEEETSAHPAPTPPESVESDFEPELFPSELDHHDTIDLGVVLPEELSVPRETHPVEDALIMQWDELLDDTTEEMISSPEVELNSFASGTLDPDQENTVSAASPEHVVSSGSECTDIVSLERSDPGEEARHDSPQVNRNDLEPSANSVETLQETGSSGLHPPDSQPELALEPPSDSLTNVHTDEVSDPGLALPEALPPEQLDSEKKISDDSNFSG